jgi:hypothetical protein
MEPRWVNLRIVAVIVVLSIVGFAVALFGIYLIDEYGFLLPPR